MIIAVDFDGTLCLDGEWPQPGRPNNKLINYLKDRQKLGDKLILWTCRTQAHLDVAVHWCEEQGLVFDAINDNLPEIIELWGINSRKIDCDIYIDDKSVWEDVYDKYPIDGIAE